MMSCKSHDAGSLVPGCASGRDEGGVVQGEDSAQHGSCFGGIHTGKAQPGSLSPLLGTTDKSQNPIPT